MADEHDSNPTTPNSLALLRHDPWVAAAVVHDVRPAGVRVTRQLLPAERAARVVGRDAERWLVLERLGLVALGDQVLRERRDLDHLWADARSMDT